MSQAVHSMSMLVGNVSASGQHWDGCAPRPREIAIVTDACWRDRSGARPNANDSMEDELLDEVLPECCPVSEPQASWAGA